jgi:tetratricopeptide (TPR) repeat protein
MINKNSKRDLPKNAENLLRALPEFWKILRDVFLGTSTILGLILPASSFGNFFGIDFSWFQQFGIYGVYFALIHAILGGVFFAAVMTGWRSVNSSVNLDFSNDPDSASKLSGGLVGEIQKLYKKDNLLDTVRFGHIVSRQLWLSGRYKDRVVIGGMVEDAASKLGLVEQQIAALLDDIGWTNLRIGNPSMAEKNIQYGIELAVKNNLYYYAAKGERHLSGIADRYRKNPTEAQKHLDKAKGYIQKIDNPEQKSEMNAGLAYAFAELNLSRNRLDDALKYSVEAKTMYDSMEHQQERAVKLNWQIGRIYLKKGMIKQAKDIFRKGLEESKQLSRADQRAKNLLGMGEAYFQDGEYQKSIESLNEAKALFDEMSLDEEANLAKDLIDKANFEIIKQQRPK